MSGSDRAPPVGFGIGASSLARWPKGWLGSDWESESGCFSGHQGASTCIGLGRSRSTRVGEPAISSLNSAQTAPSFHLWTFVEF